MAFLEELTKSKQAINFSGVGASHQNGIAKGAIGIIQNMARTTMIHAAMHHSDGTIDTSLWPMVMDYACWIYNQVLQQDMASLLSISGRVPRFSQLLTFQVVAAYGAHPVLCWN